MQGFNRGRFSEMFGPGCPIYYNEHATREEIIDAGAEKDFTVIAIASFPIIELPKDPTPLFAKIPMGVEATAPMVP